MLDRTTSRVYIGARIHAWPRFTEPVNISTAIKQNEVAQMAVDKNTVSELARLAGIEIADDELDEVTNRFSSLMQELDRLKDLDLDNILPVSIFPEEGEV